MPFLMASENSKHLGTNLTKECQELCTENTTFLGDIKEDNVLDKSELYRVCVVEDNST